MARTTVGSPLHLQLGLDELAAGVQTHLVENLLEFFFVTALLRVAAFDLMTIFVVIVRLAVFAVSAGVVRLRVLVPLVPGLLAVASLETVLIVALQHLLGLLFEKFPSFLGLCLGVTHYKVIII